MVHVSEGRFDAGDGGPTDAAPPPAPDEHDGALAELGVLLLDAGLSVTDVRAALESVRSANLPDAAMSFAVLPSAVFVSRSDRGGRVVMGNASAEPLSVRQSAHASRLVHRLAARVVRPDAIEERIREIRALPFRHRSLAWIAGSALIAAGLAVLFRCPWWAILVATLVGVVVGAITTVMNRVGPAAAIVPFVSAFVSTLLVGAIAGWLAVGPVPLFAVAAPIAILVPGALITNALLELTAADIVTGSARLAYGLIVLGFMTVGIIAGGAVTGLRVDPDSAALIGQAASVSTEHGGWSALPPLWLSWIGVAVLAAGLGLAFGSGARLMGVSVVVMCCTYAVLVALTPVFGSAVATGAAAAALFVAARLLERMTFAVPATISFQPAFLLLVPGTVGLVALTSLDTESIAAAPLVFVSLCIGTKVGSVIIDTPWAAAFREAARRTVPANSARDRPRAPTRSR